jgi:hypothetical protein
VEKGIEMMARSAGGFSSVASHAEPIAKSATKSITKLNIARASHPALGFITCPSRQAASERISLGVGEIDRALDPYEGKGIEYAGLHEIRSSTTLSFAAAAGFALVLGNHMERQRSGREAGIGDGQFAEIEALRPVFWIGDKFCQAEGGNFYGPGLYPLGIEPGRLIRVLPRNFDEALWAAGEISRTGKIGFGIFEVRGNPHKLDLAITRRLLLRCQTSQVPFFILRQAGSAEASAASTRWLIHPACSRNIDQETQDNSGQMDLMGITAWNVSLEKCRGGKTGNWRVEWNHHEQAFKIPDRIPSKTTGKIIGEFSAQQSSQQSDQRSGQLGTGAALSGGVFAATGN